LPDRHGFPARVIVPGYFGETHVKWITRIEVADESAIGFYEETRLGPGLYRADALAVRRPGPESTFTSTSRRMEFRWRGSLAAIAGSRVSR